MGKRGQGRRGRGRKPKAPQINVGLCMDCGWIGTGAEGEVAGAPCPKCDEPMGMGKRRVQTDG